MSAAVFLSGSVVHSPPRVAPAPSKDESHPASITPSQWPNHRLPCTQGHPRSWAGSPPSLCPAPGPRWWWRARVKGKKRWQLDEGEEHHHSRARPGLGPGDKGQRGQTRCRWSQPGDGAAWMWEGWTQRTWQPGDWMSEGVSPEGTQWKLGALMMLEGVQDAGESLGHKVRLLRGLPWPLPSSVPPKSPLHCLCPTKGLPYPWDYF